jgi:hypothetical protein
MRGLLSGWAPITDGDAETAQLTLRFSSTLEITALSGDFENREPIRRLVAMVGVFWWGRNSHGLTLRRCDLGESGRT